MHPQTKIYVASMLGMIRQACDGIELALGTDDRASVNGTLKDMTPNFGKVDEKASYLTKEEDDKVGEMLGLVAEQPLEEETNASE